MRGTITSGAVGGKIEAATTHGELGLFRGNGRMAKLVQVGMTASVDVHLQVLRGLARGGEA